jgi:hypothetical protein
MLGLIPRFTNLPSKIFLRIQKHALTCGFTEILINLADHVGKRANKP